MIEILGFYPCQGNGGIASWTNKFLKSFPNDVFKVYPVNISPDKDFTKFKGSDRLFYGVKSFYRAYKNAKATLKEHPNIKIMHITSGGGIGVLRDYYFALLLKKYCKTILHCRFGNGPDIAERSGWNSFFFRKALNIYDQIWVLDKRSYNFIKQNPLWREKVFLTPNSIEVPDICDLTPKSYKKVGFIGNVLPTKGVFELTEAIASIDDTELYIAGGGQANVIEKIKNIAGKKNGNEIKLLGKLSNQEAVKLIETLDIICLPTYYSGEAFPISILEAMSRGKMVISCPRAAIPDMLSTINGGRCGILVPERNSHAIVKAVKWCQEHPNEADKMCKEAYKKVKTCYRKEIVYDIYRENYKKILQ